MRSATIRQGAILVGGLGTRLGALTQSTPKPLLEISGRPFLAWLMRELVRFGVEEFLLLSGHLARRVEEAVPALRAALPVPVSIDIAEEPVVAGTGGALFHAAERLHPRFLLANGDSLFDTNLSALLAGAAGDSAPVSGRLILRRLEDASRFGTVLLDGDRIAAFAERPEPGSPGVINAGIYAFDRAMLDHVAAVCSLERDVLPRLAEAGALRGTLAEGYFRDIGVPADFARAEAEIPRCLCRHALFLDRDGVVNVDHGWVGTRERFEFMPGALQAIRAATDAGWHVFVVTNQSGIARGNYDEEALTSLHKWMCDEVRGHGGTIDDIRYCPFHPEAKLERYRRVSDWRKPAPGMILDLIRAWELDPARCLLVGDQATDMQAAAAAGIAGSLFPGGNLAAFVKTLIARHGALAGSDA